MEHTFLSGLVLLSLFVLLILTVRRLRIAKNSGVRQGRSDNGLTRGDQSTVNQSSGDQGEQSVSEPAHHGHSHTEPGTPLLVPEHSDFDSVHAGKRSFGGCKFDPEEVRRTRLLAGPKIDTSNLPPVNPAVAALLAAVDIGRIKEHLLKLSGETPITLSGTAQRLATRNSHHKDLALALAYVDDYYKSINVRSVRSPYKVRGRAFENVVVEFPGSTRPGDVVIIGAHLDSTAGSPWGSESAAPGADDDASGTVALFELALALKSLSLPFTVRLVHFTGEEQGLWGSYAYSDQVARAKTNVLAMVEIDMIGYCGKPGNRVDIHDGADKNGSHDIVVRFFRNIVRYGIQLNPVDTHNHAVDDRSDHAGFLDHGYKAVLISEEFTDDGFNPNYHTTGDRVSACNLPFMVEVVKAVIALTVDLAGGK